MKKPMTLQTFVRIAMLTALATVLTMVPQIPIGNGYVHFGDCIIYLAAIFLGPIPGAIVGAVGHALADLLSGYAIFAIPTFVIKGLIGYSVGRILYHHKTSALRLSLAALAALLLVTFGYFFAEIPLYGLSASIIVFTSSPLQWLMSVVASAVLLPILSKLRTKIGLK